METCINILYKASSHYKSALKDLVIEAELPKRHKIAIKCTILTYYKYIQFPEKNKNQDLRTFKS